MIPFVVKYDYEDMYGFGATIIFAKDVEDAVKRFVRDMINRRDTKWLDHTYHRNKFRYVSTNTFGWNTFLNDSDNVCLKVREVDTKYGNIIPIQEHFDECSI